MTNPRNASRDYLTCGQVAAIVQASPHTVSKWTDSGELPCRRIGAGKSRGDRRIHKDDLAAFFRQKGWHRELAALGVAPVNVVSIAVTSDTALGAIAEAAGLRSVASVLDLASVVMAGGVNAVALDLGDLGRLQSRECVKWLSGKVKVVVGLLGDGHAMDAAFVQSLGLTGVVKLPVTSVELARKLKRIVRNGQEAKTA